MNKKSKRGKILSLTKYDYTGPSSRYRFYNYKDCFEKYGFNVTIKPFLEKKYFEKISKSEKALYVISAYLKRIGFLLKLLILPKQYDIILIEYELIPYFPHIFEWALSQKGYKYIVDYDDPLFHRYDIHSNAIIRFLFKNKIAKVMSNAEKVIVCNNYLSTYAQRHNNNLIILPTVVKLLNQYLLTSEEVKQNHINDQPVIIGWIGSKSTSKFVVDIFPALKHLAQSHNVVYRLVGFDSNLLSEGERKKANITVVPWSETNEIFEVAKMDIGIMPLRDNPWTRGKCGFKLLQYMSCSKPVVASPVGVNTTIVEEENGFLAKDINTWYEALKVLTEDVSLRDSMGKKGLKKVNERYNYSKNCIKYIQEIELMVK